MKRNRKTIFKNRKNTLRDRVLDLMGFGSDLDLADAQAYHQGFINTLDEDDDGGPDFLEFLDMIEKIAGMIADSAKEVKFRNNCELELYINTYIQEFNKNQGIFSVN